MAGDKDSSATPAADNVPPEEEAKVEDGEKGKENAPEEATAEPEDVVVVKEAKINTPPQPMPPLNDYYGMPYPPPPYANYPPPNGAYYWPRPPPGAENESKDPSPMVSPDGNKQGPYPGMYPPPYGYPPPPYQMMAPPGAPYYSPNSAPPHYRPPPGHHGGRWPPSGPLPYEGGAVPRSYSHDEQHQGWRPPPPSGGDPRGCPPPQDDSGSNKDAGGGEEATTDGSPSIAALYVKSKVRLPQNLAEKRARKNAQSRARAAKLRERIEEIEAKPEDERTQEEIDMYNGYQNRRSRKNDRSRQRAIEKKQECERILSKPENKRTPAENAYLDATMSAKAAKNEGDRLRRQRIKQAKRKQAVANINAEMFTQQPPTMQWPETPV